MGIQADHASHFNQEETPCLAGLSHFLSLPLLQEY